MPNSRKQNDSVEDHYQPWEQLKNLYLLLCGGRRVTVRSQQVRAMNLVYALHKNEKLNEGTPVAVIGGGAAGITFASAAACLGAHVKLFEAQKLMHLQLGSWHRPLHPEVYTWPDDTAYRPVSHMPLVGWTTGPAHEVATEIVAKFRSLAHQLGEPQLKIIEGKRVQVDYETGRRVKQDDEEQPPNKEIVIIATGFGVEKELPGVPLLSYWRSDYLDQPFLGKGKDRIVIVGSGDGALCDLLRACVPYTDQTAFLDTILRLTLSDEKLRNAVADIEKPSLLKNGKYLEEQYRQLDGSSLDAIQTLLRENKRKPAISVTWLFREAHPFDSHSLPIYRFLVSRLINDSGYFGLTLEREFQADKVEFKKAQWVVKRQPDKDKEQGKDKPIPYSHIVYRAGQETEEINGSSRLLSTINTFNHPKKALANFRSQPKESHKDCNEPTAWLEDKKFFNQLKVDLPRPVLLAEFVMAFNSPDFNASRRPFVFRIRIWLRGLAKGVTARYDLHPEFHKPIMRHGGDENGEQWLNTRNDYTIRVRLDDGQEWADYSVLGALHARYYEACGARLRIPVKRKVVKKKDGKVVRSYPDEEPITVDEALQTLQKQSRYATQSGAVRGPAAS